MHYEEFVADTQGILLSTEGYLLGGIITGALSAFLRYQEKEKRWFMEKEKVYYSLI